MFPILNIGPLAIQAPGLIIILGIWLGLTVIEKFAKRVPISVNDLSNIVFYFLSSWIITGRLAYILQKPNAFIQSPISILSPNTGLFDPFSAFVFSSLIIVVVIHHKKLPILAVLDGLTPGFATFMIFYFFAQFASGDLYGIPANVPWKIFLWGTFRHPLSLYYILISIPINLFLWFKPQKTTPHGFDFLFWVSYTSFCIVFLEFFRGDTNAIINGIHIPQIIAWIIFLFSIIKLNQMRRAI
ncbi:MAG: hypothetical protein CVU39_05515 [Chloroflexi bacterium HGW-Chloroflexi-10]|nr:MAG: hypothetical protein CVU39_05515 [Chloroflexi bacterium HGW-Chloroflexi-10]